MDMLAVRPARGVVLLGLVSALPAYGWQAAVRVGEPDVWVRAVATDRPGSVAVGGIVSLSGDHGVGAVAMLSSTGRKRWTTVFAEPGSRVESLHIDRRGDLIVGARVYGDDEDTLGWFVVLKLDGRTGTELWRDVVPNESGAVVVDESGDALVGIVVLEYDNSGDYVIHYLLRRLSGTDGSERWRVQDGGLPLVIEGSALVVELQEGRGVARRSPDDGGLLWQASTRADAAALDRLGDVVTLASHGGGGATITKLAALNGDVRWTRRLERAELSLESGHVVDRNGDVVVVGDAWPGPPSTNADLVVLKLAGTDGSDLWRVTMDGTTRSGSDRAYGVAVDGKGDLVVTGQLDDVDSHAILMKLRGRDGSLAWHRRDVGGAVPLTLTGSGRVVVGAGGVVPPVEPGPPWLLDGAFFATKLRGRTGGGMRRLADQ
jgi:hypothetical protein